MSAKTAPSDRVGADEPAAVQSPADPGTVYRLAAELVRRVSPAACNLRLVYDVPGVKEPGCLPLVAPAVVVSQTATDILEVLVDADGWLHGEEIGTRMNPRDPFDHTSGGFRRAIDELKAADLIDANTRKGYRAKRL